MKNRFKKGFTLIEIIIVIVIIGVLATLALPRITGQIEASRGAEAMQMFGALRRAAMNCIDMASDGTTAGANGAAPNCRTWTQLGMTSPSGAAFTYTSAFTSPTLQFRAARGANSICVNVIASTGQATYTLDPTTSANPYFGAANRTGAYTNAGCTAATGM